MNAAKTAVQRPILMTIIFGLIAVMGLYVSNNLAIDLFPDVDYPVLMVSATYEGAGPESVEKSVTKILESGLSGLSGLKTMTSTSSEGSSRISLEFNYGTDLTEATNDVRDKLGQVESSLPDDVETPSIFKFSSDSQPIMKIAVRGNRTSEDLKEMAEDSIESKFEQVAGISKASTSGGRDKIVRVELSQNRLDAYGLTITGIDSTLATQNLELGGGTITEGEKNYSVRTTGEFSSIDEVANAVVGTKNGYDVKLSDLGTVKMGYADKSSAVYINGQQGVYISLYKQSGSNSVNAANAVYKKITEVKKVLPSDVTLEIVSDDTEQIRDTVNELVKSTIEGALLAMVVLFLFLRNTKSTLIIGISIPFSILVTLLAMSLAGITLNMMSMTGLILGVGMIVDASIVMIENIFKYRERGASPKVAATLGTQEMMAAVVSGHLTIVAVFIPVLLFKSKLGMIGQIFTDMIFTISIAILASLVIAIYLVPVLASKYLVLYTRKEKPLKRPLFLKMDAFGERTMNGLVTAYRKALAWTLSHRKTTLLSVLGALFLAIAFIPRMNIMLIPNFSDSSVTLNVSMPVGTSLEVTEAQILQLEAIAKEEIKGYKTLISSVGTGNYGQTTGTYSGSLAIQLPDSKDRIDSVETIKSKLRAHFDEFPSATLTFSQGRSRQMAGGYDIDLAVRSDDLTAALSTSKQLVTLMKDKISDVAEPAMDMDEGLPQVEVVIDRERAYSMGVNIYTAATEINYAVDGVTSTVFRHSGKEYDVDLMFQDSDRAKVPDLEKIYVTGTSGRIAVANFATVTKGLGPVSINREDQTRIVHVQANIVSSEKAAAVEKKIKAAMDDAIILPDGVTVSFEGSSQDINEMGGVFLMIISMAILLVFGIMAGQYESFKDPFINLFTIPLMIIGIVAIYMLTNNPLTMFTAVGLVMLIGIVVDNGILLVDYTNRLVRRGIPLKEACLEGGTSRLRPVLMTSLTAILGMVPMGFFPSEGSKMIQPIGLTVIGGLTSSTLMTLFIIPVIYSIVNGKWKQKVTTAASDDGKERLL